MKRECGLLSVVCALSVMGVSFGLLGCGGDGDGEQVLVDPPVVVLGEGQTTVTLHATDGIPPYIWMLSASVVDMVPGAGDGSGNVPGASGAIGKLSGVPAGEPTHLDVASYSRDATAYGVDTVLVQDSRGWSGSSVISRSEPGQGTAGVLSLSPPAANLPPNETTVVVAVNGGTAPFTWSVLGGNGRLDGVPSGATELRQVLFVWTGATRPGTATVYVKDSVGGEGACLITAE